MKRVVFLIFCLFLFSCDLFRSADNYEMQLMVADEHIIMVECAPDGSVWGIRDNGVVLNYSQDVLTVYDGENAIFDTSFGFVADMAADTSGNIWIASQYDLVYFDGVVPVVYHFQTGAGEDLPVQDIEITADGDVWCSPCRCGEGGLAHFNGNEWESMYMADSLVPFGFNGNFDFDSKGQIWGAMTGLEDSYFAMYDGNDWDIYDADDLSYNPYRVGGIVVLGDDRIVGWIDYSLSSLYDPTRPDYMIFSEDDPQAELITMDSERSSLYFWSNTYHMPDDMWYVIQDSCLLSMDGEKTVSFPDEVNYVYSISNTLEGDLWLGTDAGLCKVAF